MPPAGEQNAMNVLAIDIGTTSTRGLLFGEHGDLLAAQSVPAPLLFHGHFIEQRPAAFFEAVAEICRAMAARYSVDAISITAFRSAVALVNAQGTPLCDFIMWQDNRNSEICQRYAGQDDFIFRKSGARVNTVFTATKLRWLAENRPQLYQSAHKAVTVPDYLIQQMTGEWVTDRSYGSRTHLMNIETLAWDEELCALFQVDPRLLCPLIDQGTVAGLVQRGFAEATGLPPGIPVVTAGGDQQCGALGLGVLDNTSLEVNSGTGSFVISLSSAPLLSNTSIICNVSALRGKYTIESNILSSASALNWLVREFFPEYGGEAPNFAAIDALVEAVPPGANGLYCVPHFQGCGTRNWNPAAKAAFWGFSLSSTKADMARALYEGLAAETAKSVAALPDCCRQAQRVFVAGGLSKSNIYNQILADMLNREIYRYADPQATAIGAFASAAVELGLFAGHSQALQAVRAKSGSKLYVPNAANARQYGEYIEKTEHMYRLGHHKPQ